MTKEAIGLPPKISCYLTLPYLYAVMRYRQVRNNYYRSEANEADDSVPLPPPISRRTIRMAAAAAAAVVTPSRTETTAANYGLEQSGV